MPVVYNAVDNEFAVSTGSNVNSTQNSSIFDNPPQGSKDLIVTSNTGDAHPGLFEIGETYDVQWGGTGGGGIMQNAVVVRSDQAPGGGGIVVLEGVDENGSPAQVIWTPGFDLEGWYWNNYNPSAEPQFYTEDRVSNYTHQINCFEARTRIRTVQGQTEIGNIRPGDLVRTWLATWSPVRFVRHRLENGQTAGAPVVFPAQSIGNRHPLVLSQQHRVLIIHPQLDLHFGHAAMLAPARAFCGLWGIALRPRPVVRYVHLAFDGHDAVKAEGIWCESLFAKDPVPLSGSNDSAHANLAALHHDRTFAPTLTASEAAAFLPKLDTIHPDFAHAPRKILAPVPLAVC